jgi:hypothetical protein
MNDLVTVTCNKDKRYMQLQAESIQKFLYPCAHWVIINEDDVDIDAWEKFLSPFYDKHKLILLSREQLIPNRHDHTSWCLHEVLNHPLSGYLLQNVLKLEIAKIIQTDYLVVDTKNFFIKPSHLDEWDNYIGSEFVEFIDDVPESFLKLFPFATGNKSIFGEAIVSYAEQLNKEIPKYYFSPKTPFKICHDVLLPYLIDDQLLQLILFNKDMQILASPSEFAFYSLLIQDRIRFGKNTIASRTESKVEIKFVFMNSDFEKDLKSEGECFRFFDAPNFKLLGFHRDFLAKCDPGHIHALNIYLKNKGFEFQY